MPAPPAVKRSSFDKIQIGDYLSETQYYKVVDKKGGKIYVSNERGFEFNISSNIVEEGMLTANQFEEEKKVNRTDIVNLLENAKDTIFTVNFNKLPNEKSMLEELKNVKISDLGSETELKKLAKRMNMGEERTLIGHLNHSEPKLGRSNVTDLEIPVGQHRSRLVDHRTINWLIINNVKYVVK